MKNLYLTNRFFGLCGILVVAFATSFFVPLIFQLAQVALALSFALVALDFSLLFGKQNLAIARRKLPKIFSLSDANPVVLILTNQSRQRLFFKIIDEIPFQFQERNFLLHASVNPGETQEISYELRPLQRGAYVFNRINLFATTLLGLAERRISIPAEAQVPVYPSILQMKQYEYRAFDRLSNQQGIKRLRRIGHSYEFEQIKNYVPGDDHRSINWKASSRRADLMVNQYEDERAQQVYCIIDKSRAMRMPFDGLSLMDYAVNTSLAVSNIALKKYDRAGLITFSDKMGATLKADNKATQLSKILLTLYNESDRPKEANYELLYQATRKLITGGRSLLLLFTNFESSYALDRVMPILRRINNNHLLVVIFFENTEIRDFVNQEATTLEGIYRQTVAQKFMAEKSAMVNKLKQFGIQAILTEPQALSMNTINKYLELKSRGLI
ncbi:MAG: DUF58 domain-containing protein [Saprospiraceae bacterium]|nr:DUF58 domain-containing protein [Saprospiraceae bacterium]